MDLEDLDPYWHRWHVRGPAGTPARLLAALDANLPAGWRRLDEADVARGRPIVQKGAAWYGIDPSPASAGVTLSLVGRSDAELGGGALWTSAPLNSSPPAVAAGLGHLRRFLDEGVVPAAKAIGAAAHVPTSAELFLSDLSPEVRSQLAAFARAPERRLPLSRAVADLWRGFTVTAFREDADIDPERLARWLVGEGWPAETASELSWRFIDHWLLLTRYVEEGAAA